MRKFFKNVYLLGTILLIALHVNAQKGLKLEDKALSYFCNNISQVESKLIDYNIRFSGRTTGELSRVYNIAECLGEISLIKNDIPNELELDSLTAINTKVEKNVIALSKLPGCPFLKKRIFAPFNKRIYSLNVFNAVEYHGKYYVEILLKNKNLNTWIICVEINKEGKAIKHFVSSMIY